jgi:hypothetical protein
MSRIVLTNTNRLVIDDKYLCGHTPITVSVLDIHNIVETFDVTVNDILERINNIVRPVTRSSFRKKVVRDKNVIKRLNVKRGKDNVK